MCHSGVFKSALSGNRSPPCRYASMPAQTASSEYATKAADLGIPETLPLESSLLLYERNALLNRLNQVQLRFGDSLIANFHFNWLSPVKIRRTLIAGDAISTWPALAPGWPSFNLNPKQERASLRRMTEFPVDVVAVGHGEPIVKNAAEVLFRVAEQA